ncbi:MAG: ACT domain-containing protein [Phycisphaeraceae bacterium]|nr:ACT domain-containing protein [Phycisphaeraceae bacterium]
MPQVDLPPQRTRAGESAEATHRVLHLHRNVPGVLSKINALLAARGINVRSQRLETDAELGYVVLDVDPTESAAALEELESIPETVRTRVLW